MMMVIIIYADIGDDDGDYDNPRIWRKGDPPQVPADGATISIFTP